jgi:CAAX prenyl protease-like protein
MSQGTMWIVVGLLRVFVPEVIYQPSEFVIGTPTFQVQIWAPCSGYEGIGLIWVFLAAYLWTYRAMWRFPQAFILFPIGTILIWLANAGRIAGLILLGEYYSPQVALGGFHTQAGAFAFAAIGLTVIVFAQRLRWLSRTGVTYNSSSAVAPYVMPLVALLAVMMVTRAVTDRFDVLYPLRVLVVGSVLWYYRHTYLALLRPVRAESVPARQSPRENPRVDLDSVRVNRLLTRYVDGLVIPVSVGVSVFILWMAFESWVTREGTGALSPSDPSSLPPLWLALWLFFRIAGSVITVPIAEELAFRGYLMRRLESADFARISYKQFSWWAVLASSAAFGALHGRWLAGTLAGMLYAGAAIRRGQFIDTVIAHSTTNLLIAGYVVATGQWSLWG